MKKTLILVAAVALTDQLSSLYAVDESKAVSQGKKIYANGVRNNVSLCE